MDPNAGTTLPNLWAAVLTAITTIAALFATQTLIDSRTEKLITGLASVLIPLGYMIANALHHQAKARVQAAQIHAGAVSRKGPPGTAGG